MEWVLFGPSELDHDQSHLLVLLRWVVGKCRPCGLWRNGHIPRHCTSGIGASGIPLIHRMPDTHGCSRRSTRPHELVQSQRRPLALAEVLNWTSLAADRHIANLAGWDCSSAGSVSTFWVVHRVESSESVAVPAPSWEVSPMVHWISSFQWVVLLASGLLVIHDKWILGVLLVGRTLTKEVSPMLYMPRTRLWGSFPPVARHRVAQRESVCFRYQCELVGTGVSLCEQKNSLEVECGS